MKMRMFTFLFLLGCSTAHAGLMPSVEVGGREWLQPIDFTDLSWNDVSSVCDPLSGICNGSLNGIDLDGWIWAGQDETLELFGVYFPLGGLPGQIFFGEIPELAIFLQDFDATISQPDNFGVLGSLRDTPSATENYSAAAGFVEMLPIRPFVSATLVSVDLMGARDSQDPLRGAWFYRSTVPTPATPLLVILALGGFLLSRRYR